MKKNSVIRGRRVSAGSGIQMHNLHMFLDSGFARFRERPGMTGFQREKVPGAGDDGQGAMPWLGDCACCGGG